MLFDIIGINYCPNCLLIIERQRMTWTKLRGGAYKRLVKMSKSLLNAGLANRYFLKNELGDSRNKLILLQTGSVSKEILVCSIEAIHRHE